MNPLYIPCSPKAKHVRLRTGYVREPEYVRLEGWTSPVKSNLEFPNRFGRIYPAKGSDMSDHIGPELTWKPLENSIVEGFGV
jgi:hypothetical protein